MGCPESKHKELHVPDVSDSRNVSARSNAQTSSVPSVTNGVRTNRDTNVVTQDRDSESSERRSGSDGSEISKTKPGGRSSKISETKTETKAAVTPESVVNSTNMDNVNGTSGSRKGSTTSEKKTFGQSETKSILDKEKAQTNSNNKTPIPRKTSADTSFTSVFIADDDAADDSPSSARKAFQDDGIPDVVDVSDVNIGQPMSEITLDNRV